MNQLVEIRAKFLKKDDLIFNQRQRVLQKIAYVLQEDKMGNSPSLNPITNIFVDYGEKSYEADNFHPDDKVYILLNLAKILIEDKTK